MEDGLGVDPFVGIFVGGASSRMGSPKGLLSAPDGTGRPLVRRLLDEAKKALPSSQVVLVGEGDVYAALGLVCVPDARGGTGPLGGIVGLLKEAQTRGLDTVLVVACDLPYLEAPLMSRLALTSPDAAVLCPYVDDRYQPLFARYHTRILPRFEEALAGEQWALQPLLRACETEILVLSSTEESSLRDWDRPQDML